jgi:hypothetical protein
MFLKSFCGNDIRETFDLITIVDAKNAIEIYERH